MTYRARPFIVLLMSPWSQGWICCWKFTLRMAQTSKCQFFPEYTLISHQPQWNVCKYRKSFGVDYIVLFMLRFCSVLGGTTTWWKSVVKLLAALGHLLSPVLPWKRHCVSVWGGDETCAWGRCGDLENGLFLLCCCGIWEERVLTALIAHSYLFTSKSQLQRNNLLFIFPLLTHFKKRK